MSEHIEQAPHVPPFVTFVTSAVPMVFDNSLSYYEALCALWKWLQDDVVNVINNNATVTEDYIDLTNEYTQKFIELKEYVDNYFDNLDVQEEINNKLDAMVEDGTLQQLIASYLQTQIIYDTTLDMIADAEHLENGVRVETLGYRTIDDNGAAFFVIKNTGTADGKSVIALDGGLYAHMVYKHDFVTPEMFGAYGDGVNDHDDSEAIQFAFDTGKVVEFSPKTYTCFALTVTSPITIHGHGATLKRPELDIAPYSKTVNEMKWVHTIDVSEDCTITNLTFDNNCFTMWSVSDRYAQEQSASVLVTNSTKKIKFNMDNCHFKNSAGDGLHIVVNVVASISNCTSEDCFRGGIVSTGYGSEINITNWDSKVITTGVNDGIDVEVDSPSTVDAETYILNIDNFVLDYDLDISLPNKGRANLSNIIMRPFNQDTISGFYLGAKLNATLNISNSILRAGLLGSQEIYPQGGDIQMDNCHIFGNSSEFCLSIAQYQPGNLTREGSFKITNSFIECANFMRFGVFNGTIVVDGCKVNATTKCFDGINSTSAQAKNLYIMNSEFSYDSEFASFGKTQYAIDSTVNIHLYNNSYHGSTGETLTFWGNPTVFFDNTPWNGAYAITHASGANPFYYGSGRVIIVPSVASLTFRGMVAGDDIAIAKDTGKRYRYTSGTTWTEIS